MNPFDLIEQRVKRSWQSVRDRLSHKKRYPFSIENVNALHDLVQHQTPTTLVSSFPRSGNTWMRMMLADIFVSLASELANQSSSHQAGSVVSDRIIPDVYCHQITDRDSIMCSGGRIFDACGVFIKTHESIQQMNRVMDGQKHESMRHLCLFRSPEDSLVSYFHFHKLLSGSEKKIAIGIDQFCLDHLSRWENFLRGYVDLAITNTDQVRLVAYEDMLARPTQIVGECFQWFGFPIDHKVIEDAVKRQEFDRLQKHERRSAEHENQLFFRRGTSGAGREELSESTLDTIRSRTDSLMHLARQQVSVQDSNDRRQAA